MFKAFSKKVVFLLVLMLAMPALLTACSLFGGDEDEEPTPTGITLDTTQTPVYFTLGQSFSREGLVVYLDYSNNSRQDVTSQAVVNSSAFNSSVAGNYQINVTYSTYSASYSVTVSNTLLSGNVAQLFVNSYEVITQIESFGYLKVSNNQVETSYSLLTPFFDSPYISDTIIVEYIDENQIEDLYNQLFLDVFLGNGFSSNVGTVAQRDEALGFLEYDFDEIVTYIISRLENSQPVNNHLMTSVYTLISPYLMNIDLFADEDLEFEVSSEDGLYSVTLQTQNEEQPMDIKLYFDQNNIIRNIEYILNPSTTPESLLYMLHYGEKNTPTAYTNSQFVNQIVEATYLKIMQTKSVGILSFMAGGGMPGMYFVEAVKLANETPYGYFEMNSIGDLFDAEYYLENMFDLTNVFVEGEDYTAQEILEIKQNFENVFGFTLEQLYNFDTTDIEYLQIVPNACYSVYTFKGFYSLSVMPMQVVDGENNSRSLIFEVSDVVTMTFEYNTQTNLMLQFSLENSELGTYYSAFYVYE